MAPYCEKVRIDLLLFLQIKAKGKNQAKNREDSEIGKRSSRNYIAKPKLSSIHFVCQMRKKERERERERRIERKRERERERDRRIERERKRKREKD